MCGVPGDLGMPCVGARYPREHRRVGWHNASRASRIETRCGMRRAVVTIDVPDGAEVEEFENALCLQLCRFYDDSEIRIEFEESR